MTDVERLARDVLVFPAPQLTALRRALLEGPDEAAAFVLAAPVATPGGAWRLVVRKILTLAPDDYVARTPLNIELPPAVVARVMQRARAERLSVIAAHSHPMGGAVPSPEDRRGEARLVPALRRRVPGVPHGRLIVSPTATHAAVFPPGGDETVLESRSLTTIEIGTQIVVTPTDVVDDEISDDLVNVYGRQVLAFGAAGQQQLAHLRVGIVGLGGTGSIVAEQLAHLGVGHFLLIDHDDVEASNLNRVAGARLADVGRPKVDVASDAIRAINATACVETLVADVGRTAVARRLLDCDVFFSCTDSHGSRWVLTRLAYQYLVPGFDLGVAIRAIAGRVTHIVGRVQMLAPGLACLACGAELDPEQVRRDLLTDALRSEDQYIVGTAVPQPAVMSINGTVASLAVTMFLSAVLGLPNAARHQRARLDLGVVSRVEATSRPDCVVCSASGFFARGDGGGPLGRPDQEP